MNWWHNRLAKMRQQQAEGMSTAEIAEYWNLSIAQVRNLLGMIKHREGES